MSVVPKDYPEKDRPSRDGEPSHGGKSKHDHRPDRHDEPKTKAKPADDEKSHEKNVHPQTGDDLESLQTELAEAKDRALRSWAEMENFKKRLTRQAEEERRYACLPILQDLLPVLDNMQRAIDAAEKTEHGAGFLEGFTMVAQQLRVVLAKYDCKEIEALHQPFDPHLHEAVMQQANEEFPANTVVMVVEPGYQLLDRVVRPSKVIVSS